MSEDAKSEFVALKCGMDSLGGSLGEGVACTQRGEAWPSTLAGTGNGEGMGFSWVDVDPGGTTPLGT